MIGQKVHAVSMVTAAHTYHWFKVKVESLSISLLKELTSDQVGYLTKSHIDDMHVSQWFCKVECEDWWVPPAVSPTAL